MEKSINFKFPKDEAVMIEDVVRKIDIPIYTVEDEKWISKNISPAEQQEWYEWLSKQIGIGTVKVTSSDSDKRIESIYEVLMLLKKFSVKYDARNIASLCGIFTLEQISKFTFGGSLLIGNRDEIKKIKTLFREGYSQ